MTEKMLDFWERRKIHLITIILLGIEGVVAYVTIQKSNMIHFMILVVVAYVALLYIRIKFENGRKK